MKSNTVLVTGGTGFIGSHLVEKLVEQGYRVIIPYIYINPKSYFVANKLRDHVILSKTDLRNKRSLSRLFTKYNFYFVFHLGAQTLVTQAYKDPYETLETNIMGTVNILELARHSSSIKGIIVASSDKAYGKTTERYTEDSPLKGDHPYDVSKSATDLISQMYHRTYDLPVVVTRFANVYGEGDAHFDRLVPGLCKAIAQGEVFEIRSDGTFVRDYIYVKDVVSAYIHLFINFNKVKGEAFNVSSNDTFSVLDLVSAFEKSTKQQVKYSIVNTAKNEIPYQHLDDLKIRKTGWKNSYSIKKTMPQILKWYKNAFATL